MKISLHLGAHKTASTFIQDGFEKNLTELRAAGVDFIPTGTLRRTFTQPLNAMMQRPAEERDAMRASAAAFLTDALAASGCGRMILSDENLLGVPAHLVMAGRMYDPEPTKMATLAEVLAPHEVEIFIGTRQMAQFGRSVFCEAIRARSMPAFVPAEAFKANWMASNPRWGDLINTLRQWFPTQRVTIWDMADFKGNPLRVMNAIAGLSPGLDLDLTGASVRPSLSHDAVAKLLEIGARDGAEAMATMMEPTRVANRRGPGNWNYRMWTPDEEQQLVANYRREKNVLAMNSGQSNAPVVVLS